MADWLVGEEPARCPYPLAFIIRPTQLPSGKMLDAKGQFRLSHQTEI